MGNVNTASNTGCTIMAKDKPDLFDSGSASSKAYTAKDIEVLEGLEQLRFLEAGLPVLCVEVAAKGRLFWELNNPEDVPKIEAMMAEMAGQGVRAPLFLQ